MITRDSFVYAGSSDKETSLLEIRNQIDECSKELSANEIELKIQTMDMESCHQRWDQIRQKKQRLQDKTAENSENLISIRKDIERMENDLLRLSESRKTSDQRIESFNEEKRNLLQHKDAGHKEIQSLEDIISFKESRLRVLQTAIDEYKAQDIKKIQWERELLENDKAQKSLDQEISLLLKLMGWSKDSEKETERGLAKEKEGQSEHLNLEEEIHLIREQRQKLSDDLAVFQKALDKHNEVKTQQEQNIKDMEKQIYQLNLEKNNLESDWDKKELEKNLLER